MTDKLPPALRACADALAPAADKGQETHDERPNVFKAHYRRHAGAWTEQVGHTRPLKDCRHWLCLAARQALLGIDTASEPVSALPPDCGLSANDLYHVMLAWERMPASEEQTRIVIGLGTLREACIARGDAQVVQRLRADALAPSPKKLEALKQRIEKAGWQHSPGSMDVVYVNDVIDWLDELRADALAPPEPGQCVYCRGPFGACECSPLPAPPRADALDAPNKP